MAGAGIRWLPTLLSGFEPKPGHVGFVAYNMALGAGFLNVLWVFMPNGAIFVNHLIIDAVSTEWW
jgi:hypothetical protein